MRDEDIIKNMLINPKKESLFFLKKTEKIVKILQTLSENEITKSMKLKESYYQKLLKILKTMKNYQK